MSSLGMRTQEPEELEPPNEDLRILPGLIKIHLEQLGYTQEELASVLALPIDEMRERYDIAPNEGGGGKVRMMFG